MSVSKAPLSVHIYENDHPRLANTVRNALAKLKAEQEAQLLGNCAQDFPDYRFRTGIILGLNHAIAICEEIDKNFRGD